MKLRGCLVHALKNWKYVFENMCENTCEWKSVEIRVMFKNWKYVFELWYQMGPKQLQIFNSGRALTPVDISMWNLPCFWFNHPNLFHSLVLHPCQNLRHLKTIQDKERWMLLNYKGKIKVTKQGFLFCFMMNLSKSKITNYELCWFMFCPLLEDFSLALWWP